jgi:sialic acid synthase SpsE
LIKKIATIKKPILIAASNCSLLDLDDVVSFFCDRDIPLCINHCIPFRPSEASEDCDFELNQIDFLKTRYPKNVIGFGMHRHNNWRDSVLIAYGKGARVFERLVDIKADGIPTPRHCSLPEEVDAWFKIIISAEKMCGSAGDTQHVVFKKNQEHIDGFVRGVYAKHDLPAGHILTDECVYLALPLQKGQISCREMMNGETILQAVQKDGVIAFCNVNTPYKADSTLAKMIEQRGIDPKPTVATRGILRLI